MPLNPFNSDGTSLEHEDPISNAVKNTAKATQTQTVAQVKAANQSFVDQLYGNDTPAPDESHPQAASAPSPASHAAPTGQNAAMPQDQSKLDETRQKLAELQHLHKKNYAEPLFGEEAQRKRQQQEEQERQMKEQEEQEEEERKAQEKEQQDAEMESLMPHGKGQGKGRNRMTPPVAVTQSKTKTEINRGTSG